MVSFLAPSGQGGIVRFYPWGEISLLAAAWLPSGCVAQKAGQAGGQGPLLAGPPPPGEALGWPWAVGLGVLLGLALALALWAWRTRPPSREPGRWWGRGDVGNLKAALKLVERVIADSNHRLKVVPLDQWVARRKKRRGHKG